MSNSRQKRAARIRASYTGECYDAALSGIARELGHGLDSCTPEQQEFRVLLALGLFNRGPIAALWPARWGANELSAYTIIMSPRWNRLILIADAPHNVAGRILPGDSAIRFPGLRMERCTGHSSYLLRHVPTGAELIVTDKTSGVLSQGPDTGSYLEPWTCDDAVTGVELEHLNNVPAMTEGAQLLLAGLSVRFSARDPNRKWAIGDWHWDPLQRPRERRRKEPGLLISTPQRRLWGEGDNWEVTWTGYPYPADLAASLTDPAIGIHGARLMRHRDTYEVVLGDTLLAIREWRT